VTLDEDSLLLGRSFSSSAYILYLSFHGITAPQTSRGLLAVGPDMAEVLEAVALHKPV
jgi:hypothetical protein